MGETRNTTDQLKSISNDLNDRTFLKCHYRNFRDLYIFLKINNTDAALTIKSRGGFAPYSSHQFLAVGLCSYSPRNELEITLDKVDKE